MLKSKSIAMWVNKKQLISAFRISFLVFSVFLVFGFAKNVDAALIIQAPKYIGLNSGLVGYWSFDGKDMA